MMQKTFLLLAIVLFAIVIQYPEASGYDGNTKQVYIQGVGSIEEMYLTQGVVNTSIKFE